MTDPEECVQDDINIVRTRKRDFVGTAIALGVADLPFVNPDTNSLAIEKRRTKNALFVRITRREVP